MGSYVHVLDGRIRIKVSTIKASPLKAQELEQRLRALNPTIDVKCNITTGNVLVLFDASSIGKERILAFFSEMGCPSEAVSAPKPKNEDLSDRIVAHASDALAKRVIDIFLQVAIERLILALI